MKLRLTCVMAAVLVCTHAHAQDAPKSFTMDGEFGFILTSGNTETTSLSAGLKSTQELKDWSNEYTAEVLYKQDEIDDAIETTAQKVFVSGQGNYKLTNPRQRLFAFASYEDDRFSSFAFQSTLAMGWNEKVLNTEQQQFSYSIGPGYSFAEDQLGEDLSSVIVRGAIDYSYKLSENAMLTQVFSTEYGEDNVKSRSKTSVSAKLSNGLSMKVSLKLDHNTEVDEGRENLDTETSVTLVYSFF